MNLYLPLINTIMDIDLDRIFALLVFGLLALFFIGLNYSRIFLIILKKDYIPSPTPFLGGIFGAIALMAITNTFKPIYLLIPFIIDPGSIPLIIEFIIILISEYIAGQRIIIVGADVLLQDINEVYYTVSSTNNPPEYNRIHIYKEEDIYILNHEVREGEHYPLTEEDITISDKIKLTEEQFNQIYEYLEGGTVTLRAARYDGGDKGPFIYLYWNKDKNKYQQFSFKDYEQQLGFYKYCLSIINQSGEYQE